MKSDEVNNLLKKAFKERGLLNLNNDCKLLDLHWYYDDKPARVQYLSDRPVLLIKLSLYSANHEAFIDYKFWAILLDLGFKDKDSIDVKYQQMSMVLNRIYSEYGIIDLIRKEWTR